MAATTQTAKLNKRTFGQCKPLPAVQIHYFSQYQNHDSTPVLQGFVADAEPQADILDFFKKGFTNL